MLLRDCVLGSTALICRVEQWVVIQEIDVRIAKVFGTDTEVSSTGHFIKESHFDEYLHSLWLCKASVGVSWQYTLFY